MRRARLIPLFRKGLSWKARAKTGIGKYDPPGLKGARRKRDFHFMTRCTRLGSIPTRSRHLGSPFRKRGFKNPAGRSLPRRMDMPALAPTFLFAPLSACDTLTPELPRACFKNTSEA